MLITCTCHCGHQFHVREEYAGTTAECPNCGNATAIPMGKGQTNAEKYHRIWTPATSTPKETAPKALSPPETFSSPQAPPLPPSSSRPAAQMPEPLSKVNSSGDDLGASLCLGCLPLLFSLFLSLISGFLWLITLTTIANWLLWLSWWVVLLLSGIMVLVGLDEFPKLTVWRRLLSLGVFSVLAIAALWGHDSYYNYLFAPPDSQPATASRNNTPMPKKQKSTQLRPLEITQANLQQLETRREAVQGLLDKTKDDQQHVILQMRRLGIRTTQDLKSHPQGRVLVDEFQRLVGEVKGLEIAVVRIEEARVKTRALIRSIERSQVLGEAGLTEEEIKDLSEKLMIADEKEDGTSTPVPLDPIQTDAMLREALSQSQDDVSVPRDR